ncbi:hypothetical protein NC652_032552 [Populus alba x Populus x berolinensis]|nr:hypothetical protein NC652_032552 [Populus alba x Populus x berolinensis]
MDPTRRKSLLLGHRDDSRDFLGMLGVFEEKRQWSL